MNDRENTRRTSPDEQRRAVSEAYATRLGQRVARRDGGVSSVELEVAGYSASEVASLPGEAVACSFGCGDPTTLAGLRSGDVVLDLGSGAGIDLLLASRLVGPTGRAIGVDMTDDMLAKARANIARAGVANAEVRKGIIEDLPVDDSSVDWVISNCVINLSPEKERVFAEIARVLRPGGQMLVSDIVAEHLPDEVRELPAVRDACVAGAISESAYAAGLVAAGLTDVEVRGRVTVSAAQIERFADKAFDGLVGGEEAAALIQRFALELESEVWSAKIYARRPG